MVQPTCIGPERNSRQCCCCVVHLLGGGRRPASAATERSSATCHGLAWPAIIKQASAAPSK